MTPNSSSADAVSRPRPKPWWEFVLYPLHFVPRVLAKTSVLLAALVGIFGASVGLLLLLWMAWSIYSGNQLEDLARIFGFPLVGLAAALGVLGSALLKMGRQSALEALRGIVQVFREMRKGWIPPLDMRRSLIETWSNYLHEVIPTLRKLWSLSLKFFFALVLLFLLLSYLYVQLGTDGAEDGVQNKWDRKLEYLLESVKELQAREVPNMVVVVGEGSADVLPDAATLFHSGDVYSIAHVEQGSLKVGTGICLDDHASLPWLNTFKTALEECAKAIPACRPKVTVRGFASNAPVGLPTTLASAAGLSQAVLNCEIANRRAEEVVNFLVSKDDYKCQAGAHELPRYGKRDPCKRSKDLFKFGEADGLAFDVSYRPWHPPEEMADEKPADDGDLQGERRHKVEFFNRAVQLTLSNYRCDRGQCDAPSQEEDTGEQGATSDGDDAEDKADDSSNGTPDERVETE